MCRRWTSSTSVGGGHTKDRDLTNERCELGTPHPYHYQNSRSAILAKKHVLCEKPVTVNAAELKSLLTLARENGVFFMEGMWTRFQPLARAFKGALEDGKLGPPVSLHADLSGDFDIESAYVMHPSLSPDGPSLDAKTFQQVTGYWTLDSGAGHYSICMFLSYMTSGSQRAERTFVATVVPIRWSG